MSLYLRPKTLDEAVSLLAQTRGSILSGGTDFFPNVGDQVVPTSIVDISQLHDIRGVSSTTDEHRIGALTTWTELIASSLPPCFDALKNAAREIGCVQIQNRGTVGGNLCNASPAADSVPPLLVLDAQVELASVAGIRRVPLSEFIVGNRKTIRRSDEVLTAVIVPRVVDNAKSVFLKLGARRYLVISIAMVAAVVQTDAGGNVADARVAVGSCSAVARRLEGLERALIGIPVHVGISSFVQPKHFSALSPINDIRASASYRLDSAITLVARSLEACLSR